MRLSVASSRLFVLQNAVTPMSPRSATHANNVPRRAVSTTAVPTTSAASTEQLPVKYNTIARVTQVPHTFVNYSVTRPAVCQHCSKVMTPFRPAKHCRGELCSSVFLGFCWTEICSIRVSISVFLGVRCAEISLRVTVRFSPQVICTQP